MKVLVTGSGIREASYVENAIAYGHDVLFAPGNPSFSKIVPGVKVMDAEGMLNLAVRTKRDITIVGPEAPLCVSGIADVFAAQGVVLFGPSKIAAQTEGSKVWCKYHCNYSGVPTPNFAIYERQDIREMCEAGYIKNRGAENIVVKADGLCNGKGVLLPDTLAEIPIFCDSVFTEYGNSGSRFLIDDREEGEECSLICFHDGKTTRFLPTVQDAKLRFEIGTANNRNTGGMGAYTRPLAPETERLCEEYMLRFFAGLTRRGIPYHGFGFGGFMITKAGPKLLEWNCRGGDPEMPTILAATDFDLALYATATAHGALASLPPIKKVREAVCLNLVDPTYPGKPSLDPKTPIYGLEEAKKLGVRVLCGAVARDGTHLTTNGAGRILALTATATTVAEARELVYRAAKVVRFGTVMPGYRTDIAKDA